MKWISVVFVLTLSSSAFGQKPDSSVMTGTQFLQNCKVIIEDRRPTAADEIWDTAFCAGYMRGFVEGHGAWLKKTKSKDLGLPCIPDTVPNKQLIKIIAKYMNDHPDKLHFAASILIEEAISSAFPCK